MADRLNRERDHQNFEMTVDKSIGTSGRREFSPLRVDYAYI